MFLDVAEGCAPNMMCEASYALSMAMLCTAMVLDLGDAAISNLVKLGFCGRGLVDRDTKCHTVVTDGRPWKVSSRVLNLVTLGELLHAT